MTRSVTLLSRIVLLAAFALACASVLPVSAGAAAPTTRHAAKTCWSGYSYNGVQSPTRGYGVSANLTMNARSAVGAGHVAAWVGVGGAGMGQGGSDEWVQAG